jgi:hypothetical protein
MNSIRWDELLTVLCVYAINLLYYLEAYARLWLDELDK